MFKEIYLQIYVSQQHQQPQFIQIIILSYSCNFVNTNEDVSLNLTISQSNIHLYLP